MKVTAKISKNKWVIMAILILISGALTSCEKQELPEQSQVYLILMTPNSFRSKAHGEKVRSLVAVRAEFDTDQGTINFNHLEKKGWAYHTENVYMSNGVYKITDIRLYDAHDNMIFQVHHGVPEINSGVVNWVYDPKDGECDKPSCTYDYYVEGDRYFSFQVWDL